MDQGNAQNYEIARLWALGELDILDTPPQQSFDDLTQLASLICQTPIALISLVDENRQWFKSRTGTDLLETPREVSFCAHAILGRDLFMVPDASLDPRFCNNPMVVNSPQIRFYAGMPIISTEGLALGTICVIDTQPRALGAAQRQALSSLARIVIDQLEYRRITRENALTTARLAETAKLTALGEMAAGIAHEINNPLAIILSRASYLKELATQGRVTADEVLYLSDRISSVVGRISQIVRGLSIYSADGDQEAPGRVVLSEWLSDILIFCRDRLGDLKIRLEVDDRMEGETIVCRSVALSQVVLNLLNNAIDATESLVHVDDRWIRIEVSRADAYFFLKMSNGGPPVSKRDQVRIFRPFFTTKPAGRGTGLGLSISKRIVETDGGQLFLDASAAHPLFVVQLPQ